MAIKTVQLGQNGTADYVQTLIAEVVAATPEILGALVILLIGWIFGRIFAGIVKRLADRSELDKAVLKTPLGGVMGGTESSVSSLFGKLVKWFIYGLAILAAADLLAIPLLSQWLSQAVSYLPSLIGGILVIVVGFVVADFIGDMIERTEMATGTAYTEWIAAGVRLFLYYVVIVIGLETIGVSTELLTTFGTALAWGLAVGIGLAIAVAFGWGSKDYISENISDWMDSAKEKTQEAGKR